MSLIFLRASALPSDSDMSIFLSPSPISEKLILGMGLAMFCRVALCSAELQTKLFTLILNVTLIFKYKSFLKKTGQHPSVSPSKLSRKWNEDEI